MATIEEYKEAYEHISKECNTLRRENKSLHGSMQRIVKNLDRINVCLNNIYQSLSEEPEEENSQTNQTLGEKVK